MKDSFVLYTNYYPIIKNLTNEELGQLFKAIFCYQLDLPFSLDEKLSLAFGFIKNQLDIDNKKYDEKCEKMRQLAEKRWKEKEEKENANALKNMRTHTNAYKSMLNDNENDNDNENENDNENDNENENDNDNDNENDLSLKREKKNSREILNFSDLSLEEEKTLLSAISKFKNVKNPRAYLKKLLKNGDFKKILEDIEIEKNKRKQALEREHPPNPPRHEQTPEELERIKEIIGKIKNHAQEKY